MKAAIAYSVSFLFISQIFVYFWCTTIGHSSLELFYGLLYFNAIYILPSFAGNFNFLKLLEEYRVRKIYCLMVVSGCNVAVVNLGSLLFFKKILSISFNEMTFGAIVYGTILAATCVAVLLLPVRAKALHGKT